MKRIIGVSMTALLLVIFFVALKGYGTFEANALFYNNMTGVSVIADAKILGDTRPNEHFRHISEQYGVYVAKYVFRNEDAVSVYSTDPSLDGKLRLKSGRYPVSKTEYIANGDWENAQPTGIFHYFEPSARVVLFPFENLERMGGADGLFHINTMDETVVKDIISYLNDHVGPTELFHVYGTSALSAFLPMLEASVENAQVLLIFGLVCGLVFILTAIRYAVTQSRAAAILEINGYSFWKTIRYQGRRLGLALGVSLGASLPAIALYISLYHGVHYLAGFVLADILCFCGLTLVLFLVLAACLAVQRAFYNKAEMIKRAKPFRLLSAVQWTLKYGILVFMLGSLVLIQQYQSELKEKSRSDEVWLRAENVYAVLSKYMPEQVDIRRDYEQRAYAVYKDWEENLNGFLIEAINYEKLGDGEYIYNANTAGGKSLYAPNGLSITVNKNYLRRHPVHAAEAGADVLSRLVYDPNTENILVPASLRPREEEIRTNFLKGFAFQKISIGNKYNQELGLPALPLDENDLKINIIYVEDGETYFTYNLYIEPEKQNQITDPIVVVDTGNMDISYYLAYLTHACFYESANIEPVADLLPYAAEHRMESIYNSVESIFSYRARGIQETAERLRDTMVVEALLFIGFILSIYLYNASYYEKNKYELHIKRLHGFGFFRLNGRMLAVGFACSLLVVLPFAVAPAVKAVLLLADLLFTIAFGFYINKKSSLSIIKGEH